MFFESTIHNKIINLSALRKWLEQECGCEERQKILASPRFTKHEAAIRMIVAGQDMWNSPDSTLISYREYYFINYAAFATNSHMGESSVKEANYCHLPGRSEKQTSAYVSMRSGFVETIINQNTEKAFRAQPTIRATKYTTAGKAGERMCSHGSEFTEKEYKHHIGGQLKTREMIKHILERQQQLTNLPSLVTRNYQRGLPVGNMLPSAARGVCRCFRFTDR
jgi:hypothetical protein